MGGVDWQFNWYRNGSDVSPRNLPLKMKIRPRFTVRTLAIFVTLVCAYFGALEATKRYGVPMVIQQEPEAKEVLASGPFVVRYTWMSGIWFKGYRDYRNYYF